MLLSDVHYLVNGLGVILHLQEFIFEFVNNVRLRLSSLTQLGTILHPSSSCLHNIPSNTSNLPEMYFVSSRVISVLLTTRAVITTMSIVINLHWPWCKFCGGPQPPLRMLPVSWRALMLPLQQVSFPLLRLSMGSRFLM